MTEVRYTAYLEGSLVLSKFGDWIHNGSPFKNERLSHLFHRSIVWDENVASYFVRIGAEQASFTIEDVPYFVTSFDSTTIPWTLTLADGAHEPLAPETLERNSTGHVYCRIRGNHRCKFIRSAHQHLMSYAVSDTEVEIGGIRWPISLVGGPS